jgi:Acyltransferase.
MSINTHDVMYGFFFLSGLFHVWPVMRDVAAVSKKELLFVFPFGFVAYLAGVVFISRLSKSKSGQQTLDEAAERLFKENVRKFIVVKLRPHIVDGRGLTSIEPSTLPRQHRFTSSIEYV